MLFSAEDFQVSSGKDLILKIPGINEPQTETLRWTCKECGTRIAKEEDGAVSICASILDKTHLPEDFEPVMHYFYIDKIRSVHDGNLLSAKYQFSYEPTNK